VFNDSTALRAALTSLLDFKGFATDTVTKESDNATTALTRLPTISFQYFGDNPFVLGKRVETTQKATATISGGVDALNYALTRDHSVVIMATVYEPEGAVKISCRRGNYCAQFSKEVCEAIQGTEVESCNMSCIIGTTCAENLPITECNNIGGTPVETCPVPIAYTPIPTPYSPLPKYYNLHGQPLGTAKPTTPGIYIEKIGKHTRKITVM